MHYRYLSLVILCFCTSFLFGQSKKVEKDKKSKEETPAELANKVWVDNIRTVKFHVQGLPTSEPVVRLNSSTRLILRFDDVDLDVKDYVYSIQLHNRDWTLNEELTTFDFLQGFDEEVLQEYKFSRTRYSDYVHYSLVLPNERINWKLSGNYVLKIYDDSDERKLCLTRRFMVVDDQVVVNPDVRAGFTGGQSRTHQEVDFDLLFQDGVTFNAPDMITATVIQNGIWSKAILDIRPLFIKTDQLSFRYQNKICFESGKEYRFVDMRSLDNRLNFVEKIEEGDQGFDLLIKNEESRSNQNYFNSPDADGKFVIQNFDHISFRSLGNQAAIDTSITDRANLSEEEIAERTNLQDLVRDINLQDIARAEEAQQLSAEYVLTYFTLDVPQSVYGGDVYIFGELSDWRIDENFRMKYNEAGLRYEAELLLKQGYYNYMYAFQKTADKGSQRFTFEELEGNWYETDNTYQVLVYYRPFGERYDQLIGYRSFNSFE